MLELVKQMELDDGKAEDEQPRAQPAALGAQSPPDDTAREAAAAALRKWRQWTEGPYTTLMGNNLHAKQLAEWRVRLEEDLVEQEVPSNTHHRVLIGVF